MNKEEVKRRSNHIKSVLEWIMLNAPYGIASEVYYKKYEASYCDRYLYTEELEQLVYLVYRCELKTTKVYSHLEA